MQDIGQLSQLGVGVITLFILWVVVKYFIKAIEKKDGEILEMIKEFHITVTNHMVHEESAFKDMRGVQMEMLEYFKNLNGQLKHRKKK